jgi:hypothetical protein
LFRSITALQLPSISLDMLTSSCYTPVEHNEKQSRVKLPFHKMNYLRKYIYITLVAATILITIPFTGPYIFNIRGKILNRNADTKEHGLLFAGEGEFPIDTNIVYVPARYSQARPSICANGNEYFVVWDDNRMDPPLYGTDIFGARINASFELVDPSGIHINARYCPDECPSVAFNGTEYLVVWHGSPDWFEYHTIYGIRVDQYGMPIGWQIAIHKGYYSIVDHPAVVSDGMNWLVVWSQDDGIHGKRVRYDGTILDTTALSISNSGENHDHPEVAFDGAHYLIVWERTLSNQYDILGVRMDTSGNVLDTNEIQISTGTGDQRYPSICFDGINYLVVWRDDPGIVGSRIDVWGNVLDPNGIDFSTQGNSPKCAFDGSNYLTVWAESDNIFGRMINQLGIPIGAKFCICADLQKQLRPCVAFIESLYIVSWQHLEYGPSDIRGIAVSPSGAVVPQSALTISTSANEQQSPSSVYNGTDGFLVVWEDYRNNDWDIFGTRIDAQGGYSDTSSFAISTAIDSQLSPKVSSDGECYMVVWADYRNGNGDIYGARVDRSGNLLDTAGIAISLSANSEKSPNISFGDSNYLVVWQDASSISAARISQSGVVLDTNAILVTDSGGSPSVSFDGINFFVVWEKSSFIWGVRVNQAGYIIDSTDFLISTEQGYNPVTIFGGLHYLIAWTRTDWYGPSAFGHIFSIKVDTQGEVLDTTLIDFCGGGIKSNPSAKFDGNHYAISWQSKGCGEYYETTYSIHGIKIDSLQSIIDTFHISGLGNRTTPHLSSGGGLKSFLVYSGWTREYDNRIYNMDRIVGVLTPFVGVSEKASSGCSQAKYLRAYPNPFANSTTVLTDRMLDCPNIRETHLRIYDVSGRMVKSIKAEARITQLGGDLVPGVYFLKATIGDHTETHKLIKIR